jgi:hypothetical protein
MRGDAEFLQGLPADELRIGVGLRLRDLDDLFGDELGQLVGAVTGKFQLPAGAFISLDHDADLVGIERRLLEQPVDRHTPPPF